MNKQNLSACKICGRNIENSPSFFTLLFNKEVIVDGTRKVAQSTEAAKICEDCGVEGVPPVLWHLKLIHDSDTELAKKMTLLHKSVPILELLKEYGVEGERIGAGNQFLATCPFHGQEASFIIDSDKNEYFCVCEGLKGDIFSLVINLDRDIQKKYTTLKQAVDFLMQKFPPQT